MILGRGRLGSLARRGPAAHTGLSRPRVRGQERWFYLLISPWLVGLIALQVVPMLGAGALAFADWEPPLAPSWVGLDNFTALAADPRFGTAVVNTLVYGLATVIPGLAIGLGLALLLGPLRRGGTVLRTTVFMPAVVAGVATALMWGWIFNPRFGLIDGLLSDRRAGRAGLAARPGLGDAGHDRDRPVERRGQPRRLRRRAGDRAPGPARRGGARRRRARVPGSGT